MDDYNQQIKIIERLLTTSALKLRFPSSLEDNFKTYYSENYYKYVVMGLTIGAFLYLFGSTIDILFKDGLGIRLTIRFIFILPWIIACCIYAYKKHHHPLSQVLVIIGGMLLMLGIMLNSHYSPPALRSMYYYSVFLILIYLGTPTYMRFLQAAAVITYTFIVFNAFMLLSFKNSISEILNLNYLFIAGALMALFANYVAEKLRRDQYLRRMLIQLQSKQYAYLAKHDPLTGLANRTLCNIVINEAIKKAHRNKDYVALLYLDLDNFKAINDNYGHDYGDILLQQLAKRLCKIFRQDDLISRISGDEFVILLTGLNLPYQASIPAKKLLHSFKESFRLHTIEARITASLGISLYPLNSNNSDDLLKQADMAMYRAKTLGRNNYQFYQENIDAKYSKQLQLANELQLAIKHNELYLVYQPIMDIKLEKMIGMETLLRWQSRVFKAVAPHTFIPIAESLGLINEFGLWVIENGLKQYKKWLKSYHNFGYLSFNFSAIQLTTKDIVADVKNLVTKYNINPSNIGIEITESAIMKNPKISQEIISEFHEAKYKLLIDDFGTGYSSFERLKSLNIDILKIDKFFIDDIAKNSHGEQILKSMLNLAKNLNLSVVAEGVETKQQQQFLAQHGCDYIQGYIFSKPVDAKEIATLIQKHK